MAIERNQLQRAAHVMGQVEGRDIGTVASDIEAALKKDPRTAHIKFDFVGQVELMRTTFSGLGLALGLAVMVVFMIMASQFRSLRLPFIMLFTIPVALVGIVIALHGRGAGLLHHRADGDPDGHRHRGVERHPARRRRGPPARGGRRRRCDSIVEAARSRFVPIVMTSLATVIGLIPTAFGLERGTEANQPLALAVVGGLTSSTILSLFLVPTIFLLLAKRGNKVEKKWAENEGHV